MKQSINFSQFCDRFHDMDRKETIFDWLQDNTQVMEVDSETVIIAEF